MLWVFVCVGLVTLVAALYELVRAMHFNRMWAIPHASAVLLLGVAWLAGHTTAIGTVALFVALFIEVLCKLHGGPAGDIWEEPQEAEAVEADTAEPSPAEGEAEDVEAAEAITEATPPPVDEGAVETTVSNAEPVLDSEDSANLTSEGEADARAISEPEPTEISDQDIPEETGAATEVTEPHAPADAEATVEDETTQPAIAENEVADSPASSDETVDEEDTSAAVPITSETGSASEAMGAPPEEAEAEIAAEPEPEPEPELPKIRIVPAFSTCALLRSPWDAEAVEVFLASLRRGGRREAELLENGGSEFPVIGFGEMMIEIRPKAERLPRDQIDFGLAHSWDWPEAQEAARAHKACVVFTTYPCEERSREEVVLLHRDAHLALAEFAHILATFWMDAGRFVDVSHIRRTQDGGDIRATDLCITYRTFPLDGEYAGFVLSDTVGLYGFGLPDFQIVCEGDPDENISGMLYHLAESCFADGPVLESGARISTNDGVHWDVHHAESRFPPERIVTELRLVPSKQDSGDDTPQTPTGASHVEGHDESEHGTEPQSDAALDVHDVPDSDATVENDSDQAPDE